MIRKLLISFAFVIAVQAFTATEAAAQCGGAGEVPCYDWSWCAYTTPSVFGDVCWGGLVPSTPWAGCGSDRLNNWGLVCVACGAPFQPTCNYGTTCDTDQRYTPVGFCYPCGQSGQAACLSGPSCDPGNRDIFGFCSASGFSDEPTTGVSIMPTLTQPENGPVRGIADLHTHQFSNLGFGGVVFWGAPYDARGINSALAWCDYTLDFATKWSSSGLDGPIAPGVGYELHGPKALQALTHPLSNALPEGQHDVEGTGPFSGWPTYNTYTHQMMYYKWLERAYLGGVRLIVVHTVSNEALCSAGKRRADFTCNDMDAVDREIQAVKELEAAIDRMDNGLLDGSGWYQIAYSPSQARSIIRKGKLAVVLGIEVDSLFNCKPNSNCSSDYLRGQLQKYASLGVRHVFPIHQYDNAFGGAALFKDELNAGNIVVTGSHFTVRDCSADGYTYNIKQTTTDLLNWLVNGNPLPDQATYDRSAADCNARGLTATGRALVTEMMNQNFIIDTDHMSRLMLDDVLQMAQVTSTDRPNGYPLVSSHSYFMSKEATKDEFSLTDAQLQIFKNIGGMVTAGNPKGGCDTAFKDGYLFAVNAMKKDDDDQFPGVGFSTDVNGFAGNTAPRVGNSGCTDGSAVGPLQYPFNGVMGGSFDRQATGQRTFDFNTDGEAHYGLLADFFADLTRGGGLTQDDLAPLLNSAETYIRLWENVNKLPPPPQPPTIISTVLGTRALNGYYTSDVTVMWDIQSDAPFGETTLVGCGLSTVTGDTVGAGLDFTCKATNPGGTSEATVTIKRDARPPFVQVRRITAIPDSGWTNQDVTFKFMADDNHGSGVVGDSSVLVTISSEGAGQRASWTFSDQAGNTVTVQSGPVNIDKTAPRIGFRFANLPQNATPDQVLAERQKWHTQPVTLLTDPQDDLSGVASVSDTQWTFTADGSNRRQFTATDKAGNTVTVFNDPVLIDTTPPTIVFLSRAPAANAAGWNNTPVDVFWQCSDTVSGVPVPTVSRQVATETSGQSVTGTCVDNAGNQASNSVLVRIDMTPPVLTFGAQQPAANANGWNRTDVQLPFVATDALSGVASTSIPSPLLLTAEGAAISGTVNVTDVAGNTVTVASPLVKIDKTPPGIGLVSRLPAANGAGWNNTDITARWSCTDSVSGVLSPQVTHTLATEGANQSLTGTCADLAGNSASDTQGGLSLDKTPATLMLTGRLPAPNAAGWNNTPVDLTWQCSDSLSGVPASTLTRHIVSEGDAQSVTQICVDNAGNTSSGTVGNIRIDLTPPVLTYGAQQPPANANGWNRTDVQLPFVATDALSGVASMSIPSPLMLTAEGAAISGAVTVTDVAGNTANFTSPPVRIDKTAPAITFASRLPAANENGWNNSDITALWSCADTLSGVVSPQVSQTLSSEGANQSLTGTCADLAGNTTADTRGGLSLDKTPPVVQCAADPVMLWPPNNQMKPVNVALTFTDALSGTWSFAMTGAASSEAGGADDITGFTVGTTTLGGSLRAQRDGAGAGRLYTLGYQGRDRAGNTAACSTVVAVPRDNSQQQ